MHTIRRLSSLGPLARTHRSKAPLAEAGQCPLTDDLMLEIYAMLEPRDQAVMLRLVSDPGVVLLWPLILNNTHTRTVKAYIQASHKHALVHSQTTELRSLFRIPETCTEIPESRSFCEIAYHATSLLVFELSSGYHQATSGSSTGRASNIF
jgi:hypothetical protein